MKWKTIELTPGHTVRERDDEMIQLSYKHHARGTSGWEVLVYTDRMIVYRNRRDPRRISIAVREDLLDEHP